MVIEDNILAIFGRNGSMTGVANGWEFGGMLLSVNAIQFNPMHQIARSACSRSPTFGNPQVSLIL